MKKGVLGLVVFAALFVLVGGPLMAHAQTDQFGNQISQDYLEKARITDASVSQTEADAWSGVTSPTQTVTVTVLDGPDTGTTTSFQNDYTQVKSGDLVYIRHTTGGDAPDMWSISDPYRLNVLMWIAIAFVALLFIFGGVQGIRGLATLLGSLALIFYVLIPGLYSGFSPILISIGVASLIIIVGSYVTHGFSRTTTLAMLSMIVTVVVVGAATYFVIHWAQLSGFTTETNSYLNIETQGHLDMIGLLFGGIMIGLLGVLYDIAIGQAITVEELIAAGTHYTRKQVYTRAMRVGREHIGALVNTLAIAYVGASLPLLLLFKQSDTSIWYVINSELFATEIIRILMGSIGLILAVPITTLLTTYILYGKKPAKPASHGHSHSHAD